jgi:hypothetical protein
MQREARQLSLEREEEKREDFLLCRFPGSAIRPSDKSRRLERWEVKKMG